MGDTLARISEVAALRYGDDVEADAITAGGPVLIRASKSDQQDESSTRFIGPATCAAGQRYLEAAARGPVTRRRGKSAHQLSCSVLKPAHRVRRSATAPTSDFLTSAGIG